MLMLAALTTSQTTELLSLLSKETVLGSVFKINMFNVEKMFYVDFQREPVGGTERRLGKKGTNNHNSRTIRFGHGQVSGSVLAGGATL